MKRPAKVTVVMLNDVVIGVFQKEGDAINLQRELSRADLGIHIHTHPIPLDDELHMRWIIAHATALRV